MCNTLWQTEDMPAKCHAGDGCHEATTEELKTRVSNDKITICMAPPVNYPAIEGFHNLWGRIDPVTKAFTPLPVLTQSKLYSNAQPGEVKDWACKAHQHAEKVLDLKENEYYVVLYYTGCEVEIQGCPPGTVLVSRKTLTALVKPFGLTILLDEIERRAKEKQEGQQRKKREQKKESIHAEF